MQRVRMGVIGVGRFGRHHAAVLARLPFVDLVALCDRDEARARETAERLGVPHAVGGSADLFRLDLDAVTVATGIGQHRGPVLAALEAGCHVLCEKPLAVTLETIDEMAAAARRAGRFLMPGHILRFDLHYRALADRVADGEVGRPRSILCTRNVGRSHLEWHSPPFTPVFETGLHDIDVIRWLTGSEVVRVYAAASRWARRDLDDTFWAVLTLADGTVCALGTCWLLPGGAPSGLEARLEVLGTAGRAALALPGPTVEVSTDRGTEHPDTAYWPVAGGATRGAIHAELEYFAACCLTGEPPEAVTVEDARRALAVALAIHRSAETGRPVDLDPHQAPGPSRAP